MMKFPDGFDADMAYQLREREPATMEDMQKIAVSIEANLPKLLEAQASALPPNKLRNRGICGS